MPRTEERRGYKRAPIALTNERLIPNNEEAARLPRHGTTPKPCSLDRHTKGSGGL